MKTLELAALLLVAGSLLATAGCSHPAESAEEADQAAARGDRLAVDLVRVERSEIRDTLELVGTLMPIHTTTIVSEVDGVIVGFGDAERNVDTPGDRRAGGPPLGPDIGQEVAAGSVLVEIRPLDFQLDLAAAEASYLLTQRELENLLASRRPEEIARLEAVLAQARAKLVQTEADLERSKLLMAKRATSKGNHDAAVAAHRSAEAAVRQADAALKHYLATPTKEQIEVAHAALAAAKTKVDRAKADLEKTTIEAPYDGVVTERWVDIGDRVTAMPRVEIMQLVDPGVLFAEVCVPEKFQGRIQRGAMGSVQAEGVAENVPACVELIGGKVDPGTRTFRVKMAIDNRARLLRPGGFVHVEMPVGAAARSLLAPHDAVTFAEGRPVVFVYQQGTVHRRPVELGIGNRQQYEITAGLEEGEQIVAGSTSLLADGMAVVAGASEKASDERGEIVTPIAGG